MNWTTKQVPATDMFPARTDYTRTAHGVTILCVGGHPDEKADRQLYLYASPPVFALHAHVDGDDLADRAALALSALRTRLLAVEPCDSGCAFGACGRCAAIEAGVAK